MDFNGGENTGRKHLITGLTVVLVTLMAGLLVPGVFACKITGGGHGEVEGADGVPAGSFGFNVMYSDNKGGMVKGDLEFIDHVTGMNVHAWDMEGINVWEDYPSNKPGPWLKGEFWGPCSIDGEEGHSFYVYVEDAGEPGVADKFYIELDTGYMGGSMVNPILVGNIQIHKVN